MTRQRVFVLTLLAMLAFAGNSILCRLALRHTAIDPASFTGIRIVSGALALWLVCRYRPAPAAGAGDWLSALALFAYAAGFSFAYVSLPAGTGALLLFAAVQSSMIGYGLWRGERLRLAQVAGLSCAVGGMAVLCLPGASAAPWSGSILMLGAGVAWGVYSLRGKAVADPISATTGNFKRAACLAGATGLAFVGQWQWDAGGVACAVASGALTSGLGYAVWYTALRGLRSTTAATVQLSVPVIAAVAGVVLLDEALSLRLLLSSVGILGGIALFVLAGQRGR